MRESLIHRGLGAAGHVMIQEMFPRVKLEFNTPPKRFVAANGEQIIDLGRKDDSIQDKRRHSKMHIIQKCECCQASHCNADSCPSWKHRVADILEMERRSNWRSTTESTQWTCGFASMEEVQFSAGRDSGRTAFDKLVRPTAL